jgi:hypothetical protein
VILAGMDEAGYGPYLGPLLVAWTAFRVPDPAPDVPAPCLWKTLRAAVRKHPTGAEAKVWVADSKLVRPRKDGLRLLELATLSFIHHLEGAPTSTLGELLEALWCDPVRYDGCPWYEGLAQVRLPAHGWPGEIAARAERIGRACDEAEVTFLGAASLALPEWEFNEGLGEGENSEVSVSKAEVMQVQAFAPLLLELRSRFPGESIEVVADKHGGRDFYAPLLGRIFPGAPIEAVVESSRCSHYRIATRHGPLSIRFEPEADQRHFTTALASMTCKYLRELFMDRLNAFFRTRVNPDLRPTAGYPGDAERFITAIEGALPSLGIDRSRLVRMR